MLRLKRWLSIGTAAILLSGIAMGGEHGHGKHHDDGDEDRDRHYYSEHERDDLRRWYRDHDEDGDGLPPGLAKRDQLPPGLEKQLRVSGTLPPGLRRKMYRCPEEVERRLPPPPPGCEHTLIGGHIVLVNRESYVVLDIIHLELR